ncbi:hypothetical protein ABZ565_33620 [Streptomyces sp. NPDC016469]|uniref:hypothetical protein n=1 Tax=Streptomyces sp. NPDC016469 TaxID=3157191 RepID=UPI0033DE9753
MAWAHGMQGRDELHEGKEVVRLAVYAAGSRGDAVVPLREISVPVAAAPGETHVLDDGHRLMVTWGSNQGGPHGTGAAVVDAVSGKVDPRNHANIEMEVCPPGRSCSGAAFVAISKAGPVLANTDNLGGFGVPGTWKSPDVTPKGFARTTGPMDEFNGRAYGAVGTHLLTAWEGGRYPNGSGPVIMVQDVATGRVEAQVECGGLLDAVDEWGHQITASPKGRYLAAGPVAFDLQQEKGICLEGDGDRKDVSLTSITDEGMGYGIVDGTDSSDRPIHVQVPFETARPEALRTGTLIPFAQGAEYGMMTQRVAGGPVKVYARPLRSAATD